ncbi:MAG TPA: ribonuclease HII [Bacteroidales bacterium]|nr:ribonuclease HII [Bacteroidales bacterium]
MLTQYFDPTLIEAGCDEAGRGCLAGPVVAAAVILPKDYVNHQLNDSKKLSAKVRSSLREEIIMNAIAWAVASCSNTEIDEMNILRASILAMHRALEQLGTQPQLLLIDGNRFVPYKNIPHKTIIHGDATYMSIAAASVLAKTTRDEMMEQLHLQYPYYGWNKNKGYPTRTHRRGIIEHGTTPYHRLSFNLIETQTEIKFL